MGSFDSLITQSTACFGNMWPKGVLTMSDQTVTFTYMSGSLPGFSLLDLLFFSVTNVLECTPFLRNMGLVY